MPQKILNLFFIVVCLFAFSSCSSEKINEKENSSENAFKKELDAYLTQSTEKDEFSGVVLQITIEPA